MDRLLLLILFSCLDSAAGYISNGRIRTGPSGFRFASYYGNHMVLQKSPKRSTVWGYANSTDIGKIVSVALVAEDDTHKSTYQAVLEKGHNENETIWSVQLQPRPAGGPYDIAVTLEMVTITLYDVMFGDVWLCSGQSNMQFSVPQMLPDNVEMEYNKSEIYTNIRLFTVGMETSLVPLEDLKSVMEQWSRASPNALGKRNLKSFKYFSAVCWIFGRQLYESLGYPIGLVNSVWGGTPDEAWSSPDALKKCGLQEALNPIESKLELKKIILMNPVPGPYQNSVLWNAMIHPLLNLTIHGVIWYQGEADQTKNNYFCTFPAMISDWRSKFRAGTKGQTDALFPFGFVQLAGNSPPAPGNITSGFPSIRWQQTAKYGYVPNEKMPNTFMAVAMDLPDFTSPYGSVHPRDKETVGTRLAASGLAQAYNLPIKHQGPLITKISIGSEYMNLQYDDGNTPIAVRNKWGFELCCPSNDAETCNYTTYGVPWYDAPVVEFGTTNITISIGNCTSEVQAIRYEWRESPCDYKLCSVYSVDNQLPAPPVFISRDQFSPQRSSSRSYHIKW